MIRESFEVFASSRRIFFLFREKFQQDCQCSGQLNVDLSCFGVKRPAVRRHTMRVIEDYLRAWTHADSIGRAPRCGAATPYTALLLALLLHVPLLFVPLLLVPLLLLLVPLLLVLLFLLSLLLLVPDAPFFASAAPAWQTASPTSGGAASTERTAFFPAAVLP